MADEIARRLVHASGTAIPALYLLDLTDWRAVQSLLVAGAGIALALEVIRLVIGLDWAIYDRLTREYEQENLAGYALYFVSAAAVGLLAPVHVAIPAILMLTIGDPISGLLGSGSLTKETYVLLAMFGVCTGIASFFVGWLPAVLGGLAATAADGLKPVIAGYVIDDNLTIPPAAAVAMVAGTEILTTI